MSDDKEIDEILNEIKQKESSEQEEEQEEIKITIEDDAEPEEEEVEINLHDDSDETADESENDLKINIDDNEPFELVDEKLTADDDDFDDFGDDDKNPGKKKKIALIIIAVFVVIAVAAGVIAYAATRQEETETTTTTTEPTTVTTTAAPVVYTNPFTNETDYNQDAIGVRPVAIVVENASAARPQWGMDDEEYSPDIIVEGEVEGGETRMLWLYADYTSLPEQIGPVRSARPPFIKFSELFDAIFIHWGQSASKGSYVGADSVFVSDDVDHINQMTFSDSVGLFGRDTSRGTATEHTGVLYGSSLADAIVQEGFRTEVDEASFTTFSFNSEDTAVGSTVCNSISVTFSKNTNTRSWVYNEEDGLYYTSDFNNNVGRKNILILYDTTSYVVKENYKSSGNSETYCNYSLAGGNGKLASCGTVTEITWSVDNGVLEITDSNGDTVNLNTGKTWIGWASSNYGGSDLAG